jgi:hypothetical protein
VGALNCRKERLLRAKIKMETNRGPKCKTLEN